MDTATAVEDLDSGGTLSAVDAAVAARRAAEVSVLHLAAHWADLHGDNEGKTRGHGALDEEGERRVHPRFRRVGGEGSPVVAEFATAELAVSLRVHPLAARAWLADALDLRHRLPALWALTGADAPLEVWVLRKVAARTRHLPIGDAELIGEDLAGLVASLPPGRLLERLESLVVLADAAAVEAERAEQLGRRFVRFNTSDQRGLKGLYAKLSAAEAIVGEAQVQRLAEILLARDRAGNQELGRAQGGAEGPAAMHSDPIEVARSRALGLLISDPETALALINDPNPPIPEDQDGDGDGRGSRSGRVPVVLHLHLSEDALQVLAAHRAHDTAPGAPGVGRLEGTGPVTLEEALEVLGLTEVAIWPVLDPAATAPVDSYAFTGSLREAVFTRTPADTYPHGRCTSHHMETDHTIAYDEHGPPGQTRIGNAGPMTRHHHRIKTSGTMQVRQPVPDHYVWRTPHGRYRLVTHTGTHDLDPLIGSGLFTDDPLDHSLSTLLLQTRLGLLDPT